MKSPIEWTRKRLALLKNLHAKAERLWRADPENVDLREKLLKLGGKAKGYKEMLHYLEEQTKS